MQSTVIATATSPTGHEVVLKLLQFGPPTSALFACRKMCTPPHCYHPSNHALPMLDELHLSDMTIGVFPCVSDQHFFAPTFSSLAEVLSCCWQLLEGLAFFHQHRVVHRVRKASPASRNSSADSIDRTSSGPTSRRTWPPSDREATSPTQWLALTTGELACATPTSTFNCPSCCPTETRCSEDRRAPTTREPCRPKCAPASPTMPTKSTFGSLALLCCELSG